MFSFDPVKIETLRIGYADRTYPCEKHESYMKAKVIEPFIDYIIVNFLSLKKLTVELFDDGESISKTIKLFQALDLDIFHRASSNFNGHFNFNIEVSPEQFIKVRYSKLS